MIPIVLLARPDITPAYRERLTAFGIDPETPGLNPKPLPGSVRAICVVCRNSAWLGPKEQDLLTDALTTEEETLVKIECYLCAVTRETFVTFVGKRDMNVGGD